MQLRKNLMAKPKHSRIRTVVIILTALLIQQMASFPVFAAPVAILAYLPGNGPAVAPSMEGAGVTGTSLTRGSGLEQSGGDDFNSKGWTEGSLADAIEANDCLFWGFSSPGTQYELDSLSIRYDRSATGPTEIAIQIDVGSGFSTVFTDPSVGVNGENNSGIDLSAFTSVTTANFRLCGFGASTALGTFDIESTTSFDGNNGLVVFIDEPTTSVNLATFHANHDNGSTLVQWTTAAEIDNAGFNVYGGSSIDGPWARLNQNLIPATGNPTSSTDYRFADTSDAAFYLLEDVDSNGITTRHGPVGLADPHSSASGNNNLTPSVYLPVFQ